VKRSKAVAVTQWQHRFDDGGGGKTTSFSFSSSDPFVHVIDPPNLVCGGGIIPLLLSLSSFCFISNKLCNPELIHDKGCLLKSNDFFAGGIHTHPLPKCNKPQW
jgi:hypothetical protein